MKTCFQRELGVKQEIQQLRKKYEDVLTKIQSLRQVVKNTNTKLDLGACYARFFQDHVLDIKQCLAKLEEMAKSADPDRHVSFVSTPIPVYGDKSKKKLLNLDGKLDLDLTDPVQVIGFLGGTPEIHIVVTSNYGCVSLRSAFTTDDESRDKLFQISINDTEHEATQLCKRAPFATEALDQAIRAALKIQLEGGWNW